jgi:O-antigen/teichoic acid export membrane protein
VGIVSSIGGKGVGLAAPLVITPAAFAYLGPERYGLWMAVTALTGMAWFADFGLGNGLLTRLSYQSRTRREAAQDIASAYATLTAVSVVLLLGLALAYRWVPWADLLRVGEPRLAREAPVVVLICFGAFAVNVPLSLIQRIQYAQRQIGQSNAWQTLAATLSVVLVLGGIGAGLNAMVVIAGAVVALPAVNLLNTVFYFVVQNPGLRPRFAAVDRAAAACLLRLGTQFFLLSLMSSVALNVDNLLIARTLGLSAAAHYAIVSKLFAVLGLFVTLMGLSVWPANGEALARGDVAWVRRNTRRMIFLYGAVVTIAALFLVVLGRRIIGLWIGSVDLSSLPVSLLAWLGLWSFVAAITSPLFMVQNSIGMLGTQFFGWGTFLPLSIALKIFAVRNLGLYGVPVAGCVAYGLTVWPAAVVGYRKSIATVRRKVSVPDGAATPITRPDGPAGGQAIAGNGAVPVEAR